MPCVTLSEAEKVNVVKLMVAGAGWEAAEERFLVATLLPPVIVLSYYIIMSHSDTVVYIQFFYNIKAPKMM